MPKAKRVVSAAEASRRLKATLSKIPPNIKLKKIVPKGPIKPINPPSASAAAQAQNANANLKAMHRANFNKAQVKIKTELQRPGV